MATLVKWIQLAGRIALGAIFLLSGIGKLASWNTTVAFVASKGVPQALLMGATALELVGAISLLAGFKTRWGAIALLAFLAPVTVVVHDFWAVQGPAQQDQLAHFLKNLAIGGGLLTVFAAGPGALSVDAWRAKVMVAARGSDDVTRGAA